jgi:SAM-dependent methyltransferase
MNKVIVNYVNPKTQVALLACEQGLFDPETGIIFPIICGVPRFCGVDNYSKSFGFQWNQFDRTQLDRTSDATQSEDRFYTTTGWNPMSLSQCSMLEVGSGAGRFSEVFLRTTNGVLHSIDYSSAVDANMRNNATFSARFRLSQASIYEMPFADNSFDKVFCLGVLQHTPSFADSVAALVRKVRTGGEIVVDFYPIKGWYTKIHAKYFFRPITKRLPKVILLRLIRFNIGWMIIIFDILCAIRLSVLTRFLPVTDLRNFPPNLSARQRQEWAILDTFDGLSPEFDNPQRLKCVVQMFIKNGCRITYAGNVKYKTGSSTVVRAIKHCAIDQGLGCE